MAFDFLQTVKNYFTEDVVSKVAGHHMESPGAIQNGLSAVIPAILSGIVNKSELSPDALAGLTTSAKESGIINSLGDAFAAGGGGIPAGGPSLLTGLFGDRFGAIANSITGFTGLKGATVSSLMGTIAPLALSVLGKHATDNHLSPGGVAALLSTQKNSILASMPAGLNTTGLPDHEHRREHLHTAYANAAHTIPEASKKVNWLWPVLVLAGIMLVGWWIIQSTNKHSQLSIASTDSMVSPATTMIDSVIGDKKSVKIKLPNGVELDAYKGGMEELLIAFISDSGSIAGKDNWFDFNNLNFKLGTSEILPESEGELRNIVKILQAFPAVQIKVGGYTDKTGSEPANKKLSQARADAIAGELKNEGVGSQVTGAEGYGSEFAKYPADAPEAERVKDRRVSVSVRKK